MQRIDYAVEHFLDLLDVVKDAVVSALGDGQHARFGGDLRSEGMRFNLFADVFPTEFVFRNRADDPVMIAGRHQEYRHGTGHDDRMQHRLVAITVDDDDVTRCDGRMPDDLVRSRGAVGDEKQVVGVEDARRVAFGSSHRAGVIEQLPQFLDGVANVGAQHVFAEELMEHPANRAFQKCHAAGMTRAVPRVRAILGVVRQCPEKRRRQALEVSACLPDDVAADELRRILEHVDETVQFAENVVRNMPRGSCFAVQKDRNILVPTADFLDEGPQVGHRLFGAVAAERLVVDGQDECRGPALLLGEGGQVAKAGDAENVETFLLDGLGQRPDAQSAGIFRAEVFVDDDYREVEMHGRSNSKSATESERR